MKTSHVRVLTKNNWSRWTGSQLLSPSNNDGLGTNEYSVGEFSVHNITTASHNIPN